VVTVEVIVTQRLCLLLRKHERLSRGIIEMLEMLEHGGRGAVRLID
jgi:hypothetical protein